MCEKNLEFGCMHVNKKNIFCIFEIRNLLSCFLKFHEKLDISNIKSISYNVCLQPNIKWDSFLKRRYVFVFLK
jgi:hypothetical protein